MATNARQQALQRKVEAFQEWFLELYQEVDNGILDRYLKTKRHNAVQPITAAVRAAGLDPATEQGDRMVRLLATLDAVQEKLTRLRDKEAQVIMQDLVARLHA